MQSELNVANASLRRELNVGAATLLGLGSILGTGVFVSIGFVVPLAGRWTVAAVLLAAGVATCNALSSAALAAAYPRSGGTYEYGYELLHPCAGFLAGWMFLCAKSASAATAALGFSGYLLTSLEVAGERARIGCALLAVVLLTWLVASGVRRSSLVNGVLVTVTVLALASFVVKGAALAPVAGAALGTSTSLPAFLEASALMFVAFTGYGRIATLGEEVRHPRKTIPRAIVATLALSALLYVAVAWVTGRVSTPDALRAATAGGAPLAVLSNVSGARIGTLPLAGLLAAGALTAMLGVLLNLLLGLSRVVLAMARRGDLPRALALVHGPDASPRAAVVAVGGTAFAITLVGGIEAAWSFSAFTVLVYYSLTNLAALRLQGAQRLYSRAWSVLGLLGCLGLAFWVDRTAWGLGLGALALGSIWFALAARRR